LAMSVASSNVFLVKISSVMKEPGTGCWVSDAARKMSHMLL
jgi:hypothetical protein